MTGLKSLFVAMLLAAGAVALDSPAAFARIVCNEWGQCWRVHGHYPYYPGWGGWNNGPYEWRGHEGGDWGEREGRGWGHWHGGHGHWEED